MGTKTLNRTILHRGWTFVVRAIHYDEGHPVSAVIDTPKAKDWDPRGRSSEEVYPFEEVLRVIAEATGRRVEVYGGHLDGGSEVWNLRDLGEANLR